MGQIDADRLSQQLDSPRQRQSQHSIMYKNYALRDDDDNEQDCDDGASGEDAAAVAGGNSGRPRGASGRGFRRYPTGLGSWGRRADEGVAGRVDRPQMRRPRSLLRPKSYRIGVGEPQTSPVREFSSKIKSACKKLNPKRLARSAHHGHGHGQQQQQQHGDTQDDASDAARYDPNALTR
ncbi:hypothetical protein LPJ53_001210 [Coemansia erecta]|uniref:Uncharacterized protein n=1 Tax=Coemansia erecta TaxID=147472 RepID=A0A9W7Y3V8_9FUNG|nr:hypothetical protein LPJ53_001210 [Coemansia erecta]